MIDVEITEPEIKINREKIKEIFRQLENEL